jgi:hypothetical protein
MNINHYSSKSTLRSHTHLQSAQANTKTKANKRVYLPCSIRTMQTRQDSTSSERRATCKTGLATVAVQCSADSLVVNQSFILRINLCDKKRHLLKAANRLPIITSMQQRITEAYLKVLPKYTIGKALGYSFSR